MTSRSVPTAAFAPIIRPVVDGVWIAGRGAGFSPAVGAVLAVCGATVVSCWTGDGGCVLTGGLTKNV